MMGVIGAEFGAAMESRVPVAEQKRTGDTSVGLQDTQHARHTSKDTIYHVHASCVTIALYNYCKPM